MPRAHPKPSSAGKGRSQLMQTAIRWQLQPHWGLRPPGGQEHTAQRDASVLAIWPSSHGSYLTGRGLARIFQRLRHRLRTNIQHHICIWRRAACSCSLLVLGIDQRRCQWCPKSSVGPQDQSETSHQPSLPGLIPSTWQASRSTASCCAICSEVDVPETVGLLPLETPAKL